MPWFNEQPRQQKEGKPSIDTEVGLFWIAHFSALIFLLARLHAHHSFFRVALMQCPVCRAENSQGPQCRRCKADLSLLFTLDRQQRRALVETLRSLQRGQFERARRFAEGADTLRHDSSSRALLAVVHLLRRDYPRAWQYYCERERQQSS